MTRRLSSRRPLVLAARDEAEAAYVATMRRTFRPLRRQVARLLDSLEGLQKADAELDLLSELRLTRMGNDIADGAREGAKTAAGVMVKAENTWFATTGATAFRDFKPLDLSEMTGMHTAELDKFGGYQGIGDTATEGINGTVARYLADPERDFRALTAELGQWLSDYKAAQIGMTETTRLSACEGTLVGRRLGAVMAEIDAVGDRRVCTVCEMGNGQQVPIEELTNTIPRHVSCRCSWGLILPDGVNEADVNLAGLPAGGD